MELAICDGAGEPSTTKKGRTVSRMEETLRQIFSQDSRVDEIVRKRPAAKEAHGSKTETRSMHPEVIRKDVYGMPQKSEEAIDGGLL